jgi:hypothetical protein
MKLLDTIVLLVDLPEHALKAGDFGAVVHVHARDTLEVEFVAPTGATRALVRLRASAGRKVCATDVMTVRRSA